MSTLSQTNERFFKYCFKGNGKYYTTEAGSRHYNNTSFENFRRRNQDCVNIIETGNDAPRGGQNGNYVIVEFTEVFYAKYQWVIDSINAEKQAKIDFENNKKEITKTTIDNIICFVQKNINEVKSSLQELDMLKSEGNQTEWQIKANSLVQKVSKNDFRALKWKEIYNLIRETV